MKKQLVAGLLAVCVAVAAIAGCGTKEPQQSGSFASGVQEGRNRSIRGIRER